MMGTSVGKNRRSGFLGSEKATKYRAESQIFHYCHKKGDDSGL